MSVEFDEAPGQVQARPGKRPSFFSRLIIKTGLAKTEPAAQGILLILTVLLLVIGFLLVRQGSAHPLPPTPEQTAL